MSKEAMKLALEALEDVQYYGSDQTKNDYDARTAAITALQKALANEALDKMAENARDLGLDYEPAQQEPIDQLIHAWQAIEETSGHVLDVGDVEGRMHMSVIRSAWEQMDSLVREIWDERGRP